MRSQEVHLDENLSAPLLALALDTITCPVFFVSGATSQICGMNAAAKEWLACQWPEAPPNDIELQVEGPTESKTPQNSVATVELPRRARRRVVLHSGKSELKIDAWLSDLRLATGNAAHAEIMHVIVLDRQPAGHMQDRRPDVAGDNSAELDPACPQPSPDPLTGLAGRRELALALDEALTSAAEEKLAVLFIDLDGLKQVNDRLGHAAGDAVLVETARRLTAAVRPADLVVRYGGDEFVIVLSGLHDPSDTARVAARLVRQFDEPVTVEGRTVSMGISLGWALSGEGYESPQALLNAADRAMYRAKAAGGGCARGAM
ncbi:MAG: GGDEF domain-containing protein [Planctomycetota bacterium]